MMDGPSEQQELATTAGVWKAAAVALLTFILGAAIPLFMTRNDVTKEDLGNYLAPLQRQLDDVVRGQGASAGQIEELKVSVATITEHLKIEDGKR